MCGFSAGGHLCASLCTHYEDIPDPIYGEVSNRPDAAVLAYPVITSGVHAHRESFVSLLGNAPPQELLDYYSLEKQVTPQTPPCFLWQTMHDAIVPVENSRLYAEACRKQGVSYAHHIFTTGIHGMGLGNEAWAAGAYGSDYVEEQCAILTKLVRQGILRRPGRDGRELDRFDDAAARAAAKCGGKAFPEAAMWPEMADQWLKNIL